jgi:hypothetical protein
MKYKIYYLRDMSGFLDKQFKKMEIDELVIKGRDNLFQSTDEAFEYLISMNNSIGNGTFTVLPYINTKE